MVMKCIYSGIISMRVILDGHGLRVHVRHLYHLLQCTVYIAPIEITVMYNALNHPGTVSCSLLQFYFILKRLNFYFPLFLCMVMYDS